VGIAYNIIIYLKKQSPRRLWCETEKKNYSKIYQFLLIPDNLICISFNYYKLDILVTKCTA